MGLISKDIFVVKLNNVWGQISCEDYEIISGAYEEFGVLTDKYFFDKRYKARWFDHGQDLRSRKVSESESRRVNEEGTYMPGRQGFRRIEAAPDHAPYGLFCVAPGHQIGFNDLKAIEVAGYLDTIAGRRAEPFNFRAGQRIQTLVETIQASSRAGAWKPVPTL